CFYLCSPSGNKAFCNSLLLPVRAVFQDNLTWRSVLVPHGKRTYPCLFSSGKHTFFQQPFQKSCFAASSASGNQDMGASLSNLVTDLLPYLFSALCHLPVAPITAFGKHLGNLF